MTRKLTATLIAGASAAVVGTATLVVTYRRLKQPEIPMEWVAFILSGLTTALIAFFVVWGHFQKDPIPGNDHNRPN